MNDNLRNEKTSLRKYFEFLKKEGIQELTEEYFLYQVCTNSFIKFSELFVNDESLKNKTKIITIYSLINFFNWFSNKKLKQNNLEAKEYIKKIIEECERIKEILNRFMDEV